MYEKKHPFQSPWLLLGGCLLFRGVLLGESRYKIENNKSINQSMQKKKK